MASRAERQAEAARRRAQVVQLRLNGANFEEIGQQLNISDTRAHQLWVDALDRTVKEPVSRWREAELQRCDQLQAAATAVLQATHHVIQAGKVIVDDQAQPYVDHGPTLAAVNTLVRVMERRARLLGLDEPARHDLTARVHAEVYSADALDREMERITNELAEQDPEWAARERRRSQLDEQLHRFDTTWSAAGAITRQPAAFIAAGLELLLERLNLTDDQRQAAEVEVERVLWKAIS